MMDSCSPRKLEPGLAKRYSKPSDLSTSTMKSEPGRSAVSTSTFAGGSVSRASSGALAGRVACACCCAPAGCPAASAAPVTALFRNLRRFDAIHTSQASDCIILQGCCGSEQRLSVVPDLSHEIAGRHWFREGGGLACPDLHAVVVTCRGAGGLHRRGEAALDRVGRWRGRARSCGGKHEIGSNRAAEPACKSTGEGGVFRVEIRQSVGPSGMGLGFGAAQQSSADHGRTGAKGEGSGDATAIADATCGNDWDLQVISQPRQQGK